MTEYLLDRMLIAGATRICFVISPGKSDIVSYFGGCIGHASLCYPEQQHPNGLCDALFHALPFLPPEEHVLVGLPDGYREAITLLAANAERQRARSLRGKTRCQARCAARSRQS